MMVVTDSNSSFNIADEQNSELDQNNDVTDEKHIAEPLAHGFYQNDDTTIRLHEKDDSFDDNWEQNETHSKIVSLVFELDEQDEENLNGSTKEQQHPKKPNLIGRMAFDKNGNEFRTSNDFYPNPNTIIAEEFDSKTVHNNDTISTINPAGGENGDTVNCDDDGNKNCDVDDHDINRNNPNSNGNEQQSINKGVRECYNGIPEATPVDDDSSFFLTATIVENERTTTQSKTTTAASTNDNSTAKDRNQQHHRRKQLFCFGIATTFIVIVVAALTVGTIRLIARRNNIDNNSKANGTESSPSPAPIQDDKKSTSLVDGTSSTMSARPINNNSLYEAFDSSADLMFAVDDYVNWRNIKSIEKKYGPIEYWDVSRITTFYTLFSADRNPNTVNFTADLQYWDISSATDLSFMFDRCEQFNSDLSKWDTRSVTDMTYMFYDCLAFDSDLSKWNVSNVKDMTGFCEDCATFNNANQSLAKWDTSNVIIMKAMFTGTTNFIGIGLNEWDVSSVQDMSSMFTDTLSFDANLSKWDLSNVTIMESIFSNAYSFRGIGLDKWDTKNVIDMSRMFLNATNLHPQLNLSAWDISSVRYVAYMFAETDTFKGIGVTNWKFNPTENIYSTGFVCDAIAFKTSYIQELAKVLSNIADCTYVDSI